MQLFFFFVKKSFDCNKTSTKTWPQGVHTKESLKGIKLTTSVDATITKPNREKKK